MAELWIPGFAGPLDDLVSRIHRRIEQFAEEAAVESLTPEPGYGFVTIRPHQRDDTPAIVIVPIGSIKRIELSSAAEERTAPGFSVPS
jgi:hypothetical protein